MSGQRVYELARNLGVSSKELMEVLEALKVDVKSHMSLLDDETAGRVSDVLERKRTGQKQRAQVQEKEERPGTAPQVTSLPAKPVAAVQARPARPARQEVAREPRRVALEGEPSVKEFAAKLGVPVSEVIKRLMKRGIFATINQRITAEAASTIALDYGYVAEVREQKRPPVPVPRAAAEREDRKGVRPRPPVVTVMGHVDHGKTSLLDALRRTNVTAHEAGGITQHIGAYQVELGGRRIVFLDTPGHEAFTAMRARGAQVTDIAVLVVAADDGVMPQTVEAINHARAAKVPIIVAINKVDKPTADPERVKRQLADLGLVPEDWGGDVVCVPVSAKERTGLEQLLEMILLVAEMQDLQVDPDRPARGTIIEAQLDKGRGPVATVLVQRGTLRVGDAIVAGVTSGRVRAMIDDRGTQVLGAGPAVPVEVLGLDDVPEAGEMLYVVRDEKQARELAARQREHQRQEETRAARRITLDDLHRKVKGGEVEELNIIVKGDVQGSVEALSQSLEALSDKEVRLNVIHSGVGAITETDVMLASASGAVVIGFNVRPDVNARKIAEAEHVDIRTFRVIYEVIDAIKAAMQGLIKPKLEEVVLGRGEVRAVFKIPKVGSVAGCYVTDGKISKNARVRVLRNEAVIHEGRLDSLKRFKEDVREVAKGLECGIAIEKFGDVREGDIIEAFTIQEVKR